MSTPTAARASIFTPAHQIGAHFFIDHGTGIVVGETTVIGENVKLYQGVTLGALSPRKGHASLPGKRHPTVGSDVTIYSGASILGGETTIGDHAVVGGNAFLTDSVAEDTQVVIRTPEPIYRERKQPGRNEHAPAGRCAAPPAGDFISALFGRLR